MVQINLLICDHSLPAPKLTGQHRGISPRVQPTTAPGAKPHLTVCQQPQLRSTNLSILKQVSMNGFSVAALYVIYEDFLISLFQYLYYLKLVKPFVQSLYENTLDDSESMSLTQFLPFCSIHYLQGFVDHTTRI